MTRTQLKTVSIAAGRDASHLSQAQKTFNTLIKQIEKARARLAGWEAAIPSYQRQYASEFVPLIEESTALQVRLVHRLDEASAQHPLKKTERRLLAEIITELAAELLAASDDAELKHIYNKHSRSDYDREQAASIAGFTTVLEDMLGLDLGDDIDPSSPEDLFKRAEAQMDERKREHAAYRQAHEERLAKRKKTPKQLAAEARQQAEAQQTSQSIREIYRKLASALHPDRETDPQERLRKTALMQRANQAYDRNDLLRLLELQLELEHIDQSAINTLSEARLKHYNAVLKEQRAELEVEIARVEAGFKAQFGLPPFGSRAPGTVLRDLAGDIAGLKHGIRELTSDLLMLEDASKLRAWLKNLRNRPRMLDPRDLPF